MLMMMVSMVGYADTDCDGGEYDDDGIAHDGGDGNVYDDEVSDDDAYNHADDDGGDGGDADADFGVGADAAPAAADVVFLRGPGHRLPDPVARTMHPAGR